MSGRCRFKIAPIRAARRACELPDVAGGFEGDVGQLRETAARRLPAAIRSRRCFRTRARRAAAESSRANTSTPPMRGGLHPEHAQHLHRRQAGTAVFDAGRFSAPTRSISGLPLASSRA